MFSVRRSLVALSLAASIVACGDGPTKPIGDQPLEGTYTLVRMNGSTLPYSTTVEGIGIRVNSGTLELRSDSTYIMNADADAMIYGGTFDYPVYSDGVYTRLENHVTFSMTLDGVPYVVSGEANKGVLVLTTDNPESPIQSMQLRRRSS